MNYKSGETPQAQDEVLGQIDGKPARGRVLAVRANGDVLVTRRAPYSGDKKPLVSEHHEVPADGLTLVYRPIRPAGAPATKRPAEAAKIPQKDATKVPAAKSPAKGK